MDRRKFLMFAGAGTLAATAVGVTGCGSDDDNGSGSNGGKSDLSTLTLMLPLYDTSAPSATGEMQQAIEKYIGKKLNVTWVPNASYDDKINVTLASDKIPMLMAADKTPTFVRSAEAGAFWDLTDKIGKYPELKSSSEQIQKNSSVNGKLYGVYKSRDAMRSALSIRKDWLDKLGLDEPKSTQDLYDIAKAFHTEKPNGKKSCTGLIIPKWPGGYGSSSPYDVIEVWYGAPNKWKVDNGKFVPGFDTDEFFEAVDFIKKMIDAGLVNDDFATLDSAKWNDPFFNGDGGMILDVSSRGLALQALFQEKDPKHYTKYVDMTGTLTGPDGQLHAYPTTGYNGFIAISKQSVRSDAELDQLLQVLAKLNAKQGQVLLNNGIEGKNFKVEDGYMVTINEDVKADAEIGAAVKSFAQLGMAVGGYKAYSTKPDALAAKRDAFHKSDTEHAVFDPSLPFVSPTYVSKGAQLDLIIGDGLLKYLAGQMDLTKFKSEIQRWHTSGGDDVAKELSDLYQKG